MSPTCNAVTLLLVIWGLAGAVWALAPTRAALQLQQLGPGLFFFLLLGIGTSVSHLEVGKRQFTCRQMAVIAVFAAQRGLEGAPIDFWTR